MGENRQHWPTDRGFDRYFGLISGASSYFHLDQAGKMAMDADRTEMNHLGARNPAKLKELSNLWDAWAARAGGQPWEKIRTAKVAK